MLEWVNIFHFWVSCPLESYHTLSQYCIHFYNISIHIVGYICEYCELNSTFNNARIKDIIDSTLYILDTGLEIHNSEENQ